MDIGRYLLSLWEESEAKCYYTGKPMKLQGYHKNDPDAVTVDRKIPELGYVKGNIVLCRSIVNRMKQDMVYSDFIAMCREVITFNSKG